MDLGLGGYNLDLGDGAKIWGKIICILMARIILGLKIWASGVRTIVSLIKDEGAKEHIMVVK